jgi:PAS domain S-box-containing protein
VVGTQREARTAVERAAPDAEYHRLLSDVADAILVADAAGRYLDANRAMADLSGYTPDELAALPAGSLLMPRRPWTAAERERFAHEGHWRGELAVRKKDGQLLPVDARLVILDQPNGPVYLTVIGRRAPLS